MLNKNSSTNTNTRYEDCEAEAAEARRQGTNIIENHLSHHLQQNPDSSYVTWIACLHPENADVTIDERFLVPGNPWWTVYEGAKAEIPTATAVPATTSTTPPPTTFSPSAKNDPIPDDVSNHSTGLDLVIGWTLCLIAILTVFGLEAAAMLVYLISAGFYRLAQALDPPNACTGIFYSVFLLVYWILALIDSSLLLASVLTTEIVAGSLFLLSGLLAGCDMAARWHQYLRRTCHLIRWAFRSKSVSAYPPRRLCCVCLPKEEEEKGDDEEDGEAVQDNQNWADQPATKEEPWTQARFPEVNDATWAESSVTPTAPPSSEHVIVLDESNIIVENDGEDGTGKKEDPW